MPQHTHCRICQTALPEPFLDLGNMPLANSFLKAPSEFAGEAAYPLAVAGCPTCSLVQLTYVVPAEQLYRDYIYVSSTSDGVTAHADYLAKTLSKQYGWGAGDLILEVASNDGTVLKAFQRQGLPVLGVEPALNIAKIAVAAGVPTVAEFFNAASAETVFASHGQAAAILGRHVFAHIDNLHEFMEAVKRCLRPDGVLLIEVPYLRDFLEKREFDTIYHEHLSYVSLKAVEHLCAQHGMALVDAETISLHGGSVIMHMRHAAASSGPSDRLRTLLAAEESLGLGRAERLAQFARDVQEWKARFEGLVRQLKADGATLIGYGAAAKANTLLCYCPEAAASLAYILDRSSHKQGKYTPGSHIKVEGVDYWQQGPRATHMVVLAWNFADEIMRQMQPFADAGGRFVVPIPEPRVV